MKQSHLAPTFAVFAVLGALVGGAAAQNYPVKTIRLIVPYTPGGLDASSEQGSRLRDATVRESGAAPSSAGVASVSGVTSPKGAPVPPSDGAPLI